MEEAREWWLEVVPSTPLYGSRGLNSAGGVYNAGIHFYAPYMGSTLSQASARIMGWEYEKPIWGPEIGKNFENSKKCSGRHSGLEHL